MVLIDVATINPFDDTRTHGVRRGQRPPQSGIPAHRQNGAGGSHASRISVRVHQT